MCGLGHRSHDEPAPARDREADPRPGQMPARVAVIGVALVLRLLLPLLTEVAGAQPLDRVAPGHPAAPARLEPVRNRGSGSGAEDQVLAGSRIRTAAVTPTPTPRDRWSAQIALIGLLESWNKNLTSEQMAGVSARVGYGLGRGWSVHGEASVLRVWQRRVDHAVLLGLSGLIRRSWWTDRRWTPYLEAGLGASQASAPVPARGTRFNYLLQSSGGVGYRWRPGVRLTGGARWFHVSNNGRRGADRNPDIQALGLHVGVEWAW